MEFRDFKGDISISPSRWNVIIRLRGEDNKGPVDAMYTASADSFFTESDGIWFGSEEERQERLAENY